MKNHLQKTTSDPTCSNMGYPVKNTEMLRSLRICKPKIVKGLNQPETIKKVELGHLLTTNNSPQCMWTFSNKQMNMDVEESAVFSKVKKANKKASELTKSNAGENHKANWMKIDKPFYNKNGINQGIPVKKKPRPNKIGLKNLKELYKVLNKIFLNQPLNLTDIQLKDYELHILTEILIRKNKKLGESR